MGRNITRKSISHDHKEEDEDASTKYEVPDTTKLLIEQEDANPKSVEADSDASKPVQEDGDTPSHAEQDIQRLNTDLTDAIDSDNKKVEEREGSANSVTLHGAVKSTNLSNSANPENEAGTGAFQSSSTESIEGNIDNDINLTEQPTIVDVNDTKVVEDQREQSAPSRKMSNSSRTLNAYNDTENVTMDVQDPFDPIATEKVASQSSVTTDEVKSRVNIDVTDSQLSLREKLGRSNEILTNEENTHSEIKRTISPSSNSEKFVDSSEYKENTLELDDHHQRNHIEDGVEDSKDSDSKVIESNNENRHNELDVEFVPIVNHDSEQSSSSHDKYKAEAPNHESRNSSTTDISTNNPENSNVDDYNNEIKKSNTEDSSNNIRSASAIDHNNEIIDSNNNGYANDPEIFRDKDDDNEHIYDDDNFEEVNEKPDASPIGSQTSLHPSSPQTGVNDSTKQNNSVSEINQIADEGIVDKEKSEYDEEKYDDDVDFEEEPEEQRPPSTTSKDNLDREVVSPPNEDENSEIRKNQNEEIMLNTENFDIDQANYDTDNFDEEETGQVAVELTEHHRSSIGSEEDIEQYSNVSSRRDSQSTQSDRERKESSDVDSVKYSSMSSSRRSSVASIENKNKKHNKKSKESKKPKDTLPQKANPLPPKAKQPVHKLPNIISKPPTLKPIVKMPNRPMVKTVKQDWLLPVPPTTSKPKHDLSYDRPWRQPGVDYSKILPPIVKAQENDDPKRKKSARLPRFNVEVLMCEGNNRKNSENQYSTIPQQIKSKAYLENDVLSITLKASRKIIEKISGVKKPHWSHLSKARRCPIDVKLLLLNEERKKAKYRAWLHESKTTMLYSHTRTYKRRVYDERVVFQSMDRNVIIGRSTGPKFRM